MSQALDSLAEQLRSAVLAADHAAAERLVSKYVETVRQVWEALPESERASSPLPNTAVECLNWARGMTIVQRAITAEQLAILDKTIRYQPVRAVQAGSTLQVTL